MGIILFILCFSKNLAVSNLVAGHKTEEKRSVIFLIDGQNLI